MAALIGSMGNTDEEEKDYKHTYKHTTDNTQGCLFDFTRVATTLPPRVSPRTKYEYLLLGGFVDKTDVRSRFRLVPCGHL